MIGRRKLRPDLQMSPTTGNLAPYFFVTPFGAVRAHDASSGFLNCRAAIQSSPACGSTSRHHGAAEQKDLRKTFPRGQGEQIPGVVS